MSSQDFTPTAFPLPANGGRGFPVVLTLAGSRERYWLYCLLFVVTFASTTMVGAAMYYDFQRGIPFDPTTVLDAAALWAQPLVGFDFGLETAWHARSMLSHFRANPWDLLSGFSFSLTLMTVLLAHELGHYFACMFHRVDASLPYFMPSPLMGTFGAFIKIRSHLPSKQALFDIGVAGPLAGFVFLLPALGVGLAFSRVVPGIGHEGVTQFGAPLLQTLLERLIFPGVRSADLYLHPVARAAWVGMFATALNLLPIGQLDGGHVVYSFFPRQHKAISIALCALLLPLGYFWLGWTFWGLILLWLGRRHPLVYDETELSPGRRRLGALALLIFLLCFTLAPLYSGAL